MASELRKSDVRVETRTTDGGREMAAAVFPSGRVALKDNGTLVFYDTIERCPATRETTELPSNVRTGVLFRREDQSGVSGTGVVADFVRFADGTVVQEWRNEENPSLDTSGVDSSGLDFRPSMGLAVQIHGHNGSTEYVYDNGEIAES